MTDAGHTPYLSPSWKWRPLILSTSETGQSVGAPGYGWWRYDPLIWWTLKRGREGLLF